MSRAYLQERLNKLLYENCEIADCWTFTGALGPTGYGNWWLKTEDHKVYVHRFVWEMLVGPIPKGHDIDHLCKNRACMNPDHLEPVTQAENNRRGWIAKKVYCKRGHPLFGDNLYINPSTGYRRCQTCYLVTKEQWRERERLKRSSTSAPATA